jgi:hypothetical protein
MAAPEGSQRVVPLQIPSMMFSTIRNQPRATMSAATWLVRREPTPTPRRPIRTKTRIIPGATAGTWWSRSSKEPPLAATAIPPPITVAATRTMASTAPASAAMISLAITKVDRRGVTRNEAVTVLCRNSAVMMSTPINRAKM